MVIIGTILIRFIQVLMFLMFARAISSWFVRDLSNPIVRFLYEVTEPLVSPVRHLLQRLGLSGGMIDFSFMITYLIMFILLDVIQGAFF